MRSLPLVVLIFVLPTLAPPNADASCNCYFVSTTQYTCTSPGCQEAIEVNVCSGYPTSCDNCIDAWDWFPCCTHYVGSAASLGSCSRPGPLPLVPHDEGALGSQLPLVYVPGCNGGYVPVPPPVARAR